MLDGLLQKRFLVEWNIGVSGYFTIFILFIVCIFSSLYLFLPKYISPIFMIISLILTILVSRYIYFHYAVVVDINSLLISLLFSFICTFIYRFFIIDREKRQITQAFAHYVDPTLVGQIAEESSEINLGGETRNLSILFSDIAGFTTLSEKLAPMDLFSLMSSYLSRMTGILTTHGGTLDKYIGDAVMGFF